jgi:hypothetical protein
MRNAECGMWNKYKCGMRNEKQAGDRRLESIFENRKSKIENFFIPHLNHSAFRIPHLYHSRRYCSESRAARRPSSTTIGVPVTGLRFTISSAS